MSLIDIIAPCQAQPRQTAATLALGKGAQQPSKIALELKRLSPRDRALAVFTLLGSWGRANAVLH
jgi:hypothetical protein